MLFKLVYFSFFLKLDILMLVNSQICSFLKTSGIISFISDKDGVNKKTVFIDKPLPCKSLRRRYQNHKFHKYSLLTCIQELKHNGCVQLENQSLKKGIFYI